MLRAIKKPRSFSGGASVQIMRSFDYARTAPEPPEGALVFAVLLVEVVMARTYAADCAAVNGFWPHPGFDDGARHRRPAAPGGSRITSFRSLPLMTTIAKFSRPRSRIRPPLMALPDAACSATRTASARRCRIVLSATRLLRSSASTSFRGRAASPPTILPVVASMACARCGRCEGSLPGRPVNPTRRRS